jgi:hypothetical protein
LHLRSNLLVEIELFNYQIEVVEERLFHVFPDVVVECRLNVERLVWLLNFLDPHIQWVKLLLDQIVEVVRCAENTRDWSHEEREESQAEELQQYWKDVLLLSFSSVVSIPNCSDDLEDPVEGKNVNWCVVFICKVWVFLVDPRSCTGFISWLSLASFLFAKVNKDTCAAMTDVNDVEDEGTEACQIVLPFLGVLLKEYREKQLQRLRDSEEVDNSEAFEEVKWEVLAPLHVEQAWYCADHIKDKVGLDVVVADRWKILVSTRSLDEVE